MTVIWYLSVDPTASLSVQTLFTWLKELKISIVRCHGTYTCARLCTLTYGNGVDIVANVDLSNYRYKCVVRIWLEI